MSGSNLDLPGALNKIAGTVNKSGQEAANVIADAVAASNGSSLLDVIEFPTTFLPFGSFGTVTLGSAGRATYMRALRGGDITSFLFRVSTQNGNVDVGVYENTGTGQSSRPGALKDSLGGIACPAVGDADEAIGATISVEAGDWIALSTDSTTAAFRGVSAGISAGVLGGMSYYSAGAAGSQYPLPANGPSLIQLVQSNLYYLLIAGKA